MINIYNIFDKIFSLFKNYYNTIMQYKNVFFILILFIMISIVYEYYDTIISIPRNIIKSSNNKSYSNNEYIKKLNEHYKEKIFPYRYFYGDDEENMLPLVAVTAFYRNEESKNLFQEYQDNNIQIIGVTAYKTFPKKIADSTPDIGTLDDTFDYIGKIKNWLCCFHDPNSYGFSSENKLIDISESDFCEIDDNPEMEKKYDFIYICLSDDEDGKTCDMDGWNAINRNFKLAKECFPIMIEEFRLKGLVIGRKNCGLEERYGDKIEVIDGLPFNEFQDKLRQSKFLFVPNIYDASPRIITESITKGLPILMNNSIVCGSKYITYETGELFIDENDIRISLRKLLDKYDKINPKEWWKKNYGKKKSGKILRDFLYESYPSMLENVKEVYFYI
jgi:hypothetical protein